MRRTTPATWAKPRRWQRAAEGEGLCLRVFTDSLSDFFHKDADPGRREAWDIIRSTPDLIWLILTKRPELAQRRLPQDWPYPNVWFGTSVGCRLSINKMDVLRQTPGHPNAVKFLTAEPLLEDIADDIDLSGFGWLIAGGESGPGPEYLWDPAGDWRREFHTGGRRAMKPEWAFRVWLKTREAGIPFFFKQARDGYPGRGKDTLGREWTEVPPPYLEWAQKP